MSLLKRFEQLNEVAPKDVDPKMEYHDTLSPKLWNGHKLRNNAKPALMAIVDEFLKFVDTDVKVLDVTILGSACNYNYSDISDIDIHIIVDYSSEDMMYKFLSAAKKNWELMHSISFKDLNAEVYVQSNDEEISKTAAIYSLKRNKWLREPSKETPPPNYKDPKIVKKAAALMTRIDKAVEKTGPEAEKELRKLKDEIKKLRQKGIEISGEYDVANLVFKTLRNNKYMDKLMKRLNEVIDERLSVKQL